MKTFLFSAFISLSVFAQTQTAYKPTDLLPLSPRVKTGVLKNGMTYYIQQNAKPEKRAELRLAVNVGSTMEDENQRGLAHFVEHMAFNGTKNFKKNDLVNYLESIGTKFGPDLNAYTSFDETVYMLQIPTDKKDIVDKGMLILKDWAHNLLFDSIEVEKERGVVLEEWRLGQGAMERMNRKTWPVMFKDSRYAERLPIGKPEVLTNCKQSLLRQFYKDWYRPDLQAIIVVGDIDLEEMEKKIIATFSDIPPAKNPKKVEKWQVPDQKDLRVAVASDKESPYNLIQMAYMQKEKHEEKTYADYKEGLMHELYNNMINSRLSELTKSPNPPFMFSYTGYFSLVRNKAAYGSFAITSNGKEKEALKALVTENERVKRHGFTATELVRQKKQMLTTIENQYNERDKTESKQIVMEYVSHFLTGDAVPGIENEYNLHKEMIPQITLEEINELARKWISNGENAVAVMMLAEKEGVKIPGDQDVKNAFAEALANKDITPYIDKALNEPLMAKKPTAQKVYKTADRGYGITEWILGNGVRVVIKPTDFKNDEILFKAQSFGGASQYSKEDHLNVDFSNMIQDESGYGKFDATALEKYLADKTANIYVGISNYEEFMQGSSNKKDFETLLQLVHLAFTKPRKDSLAFVSVMEKQKAFIQNRGSDPQQVFGDSVQYTMSGYHYTAKPLTEADLKLLNYKRAHQIFKERFSDPTDFTFYFVGSINPDSVKSLIESYLGGISASSKKETPKDMGIISPKGKLSKVIVKGNEPRSSVNLIWTSPFEYNRKSRFEAQALMKLLNIKLRENLREEKGGVYGVGIYPIMYKFPKQAMVVTCMFSCAPDNVEKLIQGVNEEIIDVKKNGCTADNLVKVKEGFLKERETQIKENNFWLSYISSSDMNEEPLNEMDAFESWVNALKSDDFKRLAEKYLSDNELKRFILNPEK